MSEFKNKSITTKGMELLSKALAGETLEFTKIQLGNGEYKGEVGIAEELVSPKQTLSITKISRKGSQVTLSTSLKLEDITSSFNWTEVGIYAKVGNEEALYMYGYTENSSYISKDSLNEKLINVTVLVSSVAEVSAVIDNSLVYLTAEALAQHDKDLEAHQDIRKMIKDINISWQGITNKPDQFEPKAHTHNKNDIKDFPTSLPANGGNAEHANYANNSGQLGGYTYEQIKALIDEAAKKGGDIVGKQIVPIGEVALTSSSRKYSYENVKGGMVRLRLALSYSTYSVYYTIRVDGVTLWTNVNPKSICTSLLDSYNGYIDIPFNTTFSVERTMNTSSGVNFNISGIVYLNQ